MAGMNEILSSEETFGNEVPLYLSFSIAPKGVLLAKIGTCWRCAKCVHVTVYPTNEHTDYEVIVLCRRLIILSPVDAAAVDESHLDHSPFGRDNEKEYATSHVACIDKRRWVLYLHSDLAFFSFGHKHLSFGGSFHRLAPPPVPQIKDY